MNRSRVIVLGLAAFAAIVAAFLVRGLLGGGTEKSAAATPPHPVSTIRVLVAAGAIQPGAALTPASVRWQVWPKSAVDSSFITGSASSDLSKIVEGTVARAPLIAGEPLTTTKIIHARAAGFMAAQLSPGMRAVSIGIDAKSGAGGFILPNDRVDVLSTHVVPGADRRFAADTIIRDVRVLAIGQTYSQKGDEKVVVGKTATLELTPGQSVVIARASASGVLSLSLRPLADASANRELASAGGDGASVAVIRYGIARGGAGQAGE